jgi:hypothetical protein
VPLRRRAIKRFDTTRAIGCRRWPSFPRTPTLRTGDSYEGVTRNLARLLAAGHKPDAAVNLALSKAGLTRYPPEATRELDSDSLTV